MAELISGRGEDGALSRIASHVHISIVNFYLGNVSEDVTVHLDRVRRCPTLSIPCAERPAVPVSEASIRALIGCPILSILGSPV